MLNESMIFQISKKTRLGNMQNHIASPLNELDIIMCQNLSENSKIDLLPRIISQTGFGLPLL